MFSKFRAIAVLVMAGILVAACAEPRSQVDANHLVATMEQANLPITGVSDQSDAACRAPDKCVQKVVTDQLTVWKFASKDEAAEYAATLRGEAHQSDYLVLEFVPGAMTDQQILNAIEMADGMNTSD